MTIFPLRGEWESLYRGHGQGYNTRGAITNGYIDESQPRCQSPEGLFIFALRPPEGSIPMPEELARGLKGVVIDKAVSVAGFSAPGSTGPGRWTEETGSEIDLTEGGRSCRN